RSIFFSEKATNNAPVLSNYQVNFIKAEKPLPPVFLSIEKTNGSILLSWNKSINPEIEGYLVYYGEEPGNYFSLGSPQDSGLTNYIMLEDLEQNKRYYFSVTSYKSLNPRLESIFSQEISITP
ncbi:MAG: fibronectin type III domain-containing protein, partial [bacterium]|nr:fibronectin type III domain-containing protein [bacterium]